MVAALPHTTAYSEHVQPAFFATTSWIRTQRVAALAIVALGLMASTLVPISVTPFILSASILFGATLVQQALGDAPSCERAKITRAVAGAFIMLFPTFGWIPGGILWHDTYLQNQGIYTL